MLSNAIVIGPERPCLLNQGDKARIGDQKSIWSEKSVVMQPYHVYNINPSASPISDSTNVTLDLNSLA
jgi:hypothetical protein